MNGEKRNGSPCRSISHQCCRASPSGTSQISPYPPEAGKVGLEGEISMGKVREKNKDLQNKKKNGILWDLSSKWMDFE